MLEIKLGVPPDCIIEIFGALPSKKNLLRPRKNGKGYFNDPKVKTAEEMFSLQVPQEYKDLVLEHPHILIEQELPKKNQRQDSDNAYTFILDCLKKNGVIKDDSINQFNGWKVLAPVVTSNRKYTRISLWKNNKT